MPKFIGFDVFKNKDQSQKQRLMRQVKPVQVGDKIFPSIARAARHFGLTPPTFSKRMEEGTQIAGFQAKRRYMHEFDLNSIISGSTH
jgi:hypothetical protein